MSQKGVKSQRFRALFIERKNTAGQCAKISLVSLMKKAYTEKNNWKGVDI